MTRKIDVGVLGATGMVGQQLIALLEQHPWFQISWLAASERSEDRRYGDLPWRLPGKVPAELTEQRVEPAWPRDAPQLIFSALDAASAAEAEPVFAAAGHYVVSNARNFWMDPFVLLLIPEVNAPHLDFSMEEVCCPVTCGPPSVAVWFCLACGRTFSGRCCERSLSRDIRVVPELTQSRQFREFLAVTG